MHDVYMPAQSPPGGVRPPESLLDGAYQWHEEPLVAFESLLKAPGFSRTSTSPSPLPAGATLRDDSVGVYKAMFKKYLRHLVGFQLTVPAATSDHVRLFIEGELSEASKETVWRYIRLLERVYDHLVDRGIVQDNVVTAWVRDRIQAGESPKVGRESERITPVSRAQVLALQDWLYTRGKRLLAEGDWRAARDVTLASVSLGSGLRCRELLVFSKDQVIYAPGPGFARSERFEFKVEELDTVATGLAHRTTIAHDACVDLMEAWWHARWRGFPVKVASGQAPLIIPNNLVFPARADGIRRLDETTVYRNLKKVAAAAISAGALTDATSWVLGRGAQGLRRAYAMTELSAGHEDQLVSFRMGLHKTRSLKRYKGTAPSAPVTTPIPPKRKR